MIVEVFLPAPFCLIDYADQVQQTGTAIRNPKYRPIFFSIRNLKLRASTAVFTSLNREITEEYACITCTSTYVVKCIMDIL
jgi:hypothetical protein